MRLFFTLFLFIAVGLHTLADAQDIEFRYFGDTARSYNLVTVSNTALDDGSYFTFGVVNGEFARISRVSESGELLAESELFPTSYTEGVVPAVVPFDGQLHIMHLAPLNPLSQQGDTIIEVRALEARTFALDLQTSAARTLDTVQLTHLRRDVNPQHWVLFDEAGDAPRLLNLFRLGGLHAEPSYTLVDYSVTTQTASRRTVYTTEEARLARISLSDDQLVVRYESSVGESPKFQRLAFGADTLRDFSPSWLPNVEAEGGLTNYKFSPRGENIEVLTRVNGADQSLPPYFILDYKNQIATEINKQPGAHLQPQIAGGYIGSDIREVPVARQTLLVANSLLRIGADGEVVKLSEEERSVSAIRHFTSTTGEQVLYQFGDREDDQGFFYATAYANEALVSTVFPYENLRTEASVFAPFAIAPSGPDAALLIARDDPNEPLQVFAADPNLVKKVPEFNRQSADLPPMQFVPGSVAQLPDETYMATSFSVLGAGASRQFHQLRYSESGNESQILSSGILWEDVPPQELTSAVDPNTGTIAILHQPTSSTDLSVSLLTPGTDSLQFMDLDEGLSYNFEAYSIQDVKTIQEGESLRITFLSIPRSSGSKPVIRTLTYNILTQERGLDVSAEVDHLGSRGAGTVYRNLGAAASDTAQVWTYVRSSAGDSIYLQSYTDDLQSLTTLRSAAPASSGAVLPIPSSSSEFALGASNGSYTVFTGLTDSIAVRSGSIELPEQLDGVVMTYFEDVVHVYGREEAPAFPDRPINFYGTAQLAPVKVSGIFSPNAPVEALAISPNPTRSATRIVLPEGANVGVLNVYSPLGAKLLSQQLGQSGVQLQIVDLSNLPAGTYYIQLEREGQLQARGTVVKL